MTADCRPGIGLTDGTRTHLPPGHSRSPRRLRDQPTCCGARSRSRTCLHAVRRDGGPGPTGSWNGQGGWIRTTGFPAPNRAVWPLTYTLRVNGARDGIRTNSIPPRESTVGGPGQVSVRVAVIEQPRFPQHRPLSRRDSHNREWRTRRDSNPRPPDRQSGMLPAALRVHGAARGIRTLACLVENQESLTARRPQRDE